jgi:protein TonB
VKGRPDLDKYGYPPDAQARSITGDCRVVVKVGADGRIREIASVTCDQPGVGFEEFIRRNAPREFRFEPAIRDGAPVESEFVFTHEFRLRG